MKHDKETLQERYILKEPYILKKKPACISRYQGVERRGESCIIAGISAVFADGQDGLGAECGRRGAGLLALCFQIGQLLQDSGQSADRPAAGLGFKGGLLLKEYRGL